MFNKYVAQGKYIKFIFLSIFILYILTGCSLEVSTDGTQAIEEPGQLSTGELEVHFLDVGQADCILIKLPNQQSILIDAGNNQDGDLVINYLKNEGIKRIDHVIGTHPHEDHIGGLDVVIDTFEIGKVYLPKVNHTTKTYEDVLLAIKNKGLKIFQAKAGVSLDVGPEVTAVFIAPNSAEYEEINNYSAVLKLVYGENSFLFTGDAEEVSELEMLSQSSLELKADLLKVGHHGSSTSTTEEFLKAVSPKYAVISVGKDNAYGHPHKETIDKLIENKIIYFRTDLHGSIIAISDGSQIRFKYKKENPEGVQNLKYNIIKEKYNIEIKNIDLEEEIIILKNNTNESIDLSGWKLVSIKGAQVYNFPRGTVLKPGKTIKIVSGKNAQTGPDTLLWTRDYVWNNDGDSAALYDNRGKLVTEYN